MLGAGCQVPGGPGFLEVAGGLGDWMVRRAKRSRVLPVGPCPDKILCLALVLAAECFRRTSAAQYSVILIRNIVLSSVSERAARHPRHQAEKG